MDLDRYDERNTSIPASVIKGFSYNDWEFSVYIFPF